MQRKPPPDRWGDKKQWDGTFAEQNAVMFDELAYHHGIDAEQRAKLETIFAKDKVIGQGNPEITKHPMSRAECVAKLAKEEVSYDDARFEKICGGKYMAPLNAETCIDRFEFPDIPCTYPVTWARANEAVEICRILGKRLCDAHEWEGACAGKLEPPDYDFGAAKKFPGDAANARKAMRGPHNLLADKNKRWAYGTEPKKGVCGTSGKKSYQCKPISWKGCGSNTFPAGSFPACTSALGVLDLHGNVAEHMNLPLAPDEMSTAREQKYGQTEMKGSWFAFDELPAHEDHCRWRAPEWHEGRVMAVNSHRNYQLGFRCCKSLDEKK